MLPIFIFLLSLPQTERAVATIEFNQRYAFAQTKMLGVRIEELRSELEEFESRIPDPERRQLLPGYRLLKERLEQAEAERFKLEVKLRRLRFR